LAVILKQIGFVAEARDLNYFFLKVFSSETVSFLRPFFLRLAKTLRPLALAILSRNPCLFFLFLREGWNVRFIFVQLKGAQRCGCFWKNQIPV